MDGTCDVSSLGVPFSLTFTVHHYQTFFLYIMGENSPTLLKSKTLMVYTMGEKFTHDKINVEKFSWCSLYGNFSKLLVSNTLDFLSTRG